MELEVRLKLVLLPCEARTNNFEERIQAIQILLMLTEEGNARKLLEEQWRHPSLISERRMGNRRKYDLFVSAIPVIFELATQEVLPLRARDELYQLLQDMVPLFIHIGTD